MTDATDLTNAEAKAAFRELLGALHSDAYISAGLTLSNYEQNKPILHAYIRPEGHMKGDTVTVFAETWRDLVEKSRDEIAARADHRAVAVTRAMALKIIEITADLGECTDRALRAEFDAKDVTAYSARAAEQANELASNGPFSVVITDGANGQPA